MRAEIHFVRINHLHDEKCPEYIAKTGMPIECTHGFDVCPNCDPCTCAIGTYICLNQ